MSKFRNILAAIFLAYSTQADLYIGTNRISNFTLGTNQVCEITYGSTVVWENISQTPDVTNGIVAWWKLDETSYNGTAGEVKDSSGQGNNGTSYGGVITNPGKIGRAGYFDGVNDAIICNVNPPTTIGNVNPPTTNFTYCCWVNLGDSAFNTTIFECGKLSDWYYADREIYVNGSGFVGFRVWRGREALLSEDAEKITDSKWHFLCVTSGLNFDGNLFVDNKLVGTIDAVYSVATSADSVRLGRGAFPDDGYLPGMIDDVRIYNRALSSNEVSAVYQAGFNSK